MPKPKQPKKGPDPIDVAQLGATVAVGRSVRQLEETVVANFDTLNKAIDDLSTSVDNLVTRLESATVEDPAIQQQIDDAVSRINELQTRVDSIGSGSAASGGTPEVSHPIADTGPQVEHRK